MVDEGRHNAICRHINAVAFAESDDRAVNCINFRPSSGEQIFKH